MYVKSTPRDGAPTQYGVIQQLTEDHVNIWCSSGTTEAEKTLHITHKDYAENWAIVMNADEIKDKGATYPFTGTAWPTAPTTRQ